MYLIFFIIHFFLVKSPVLPLSSLSGWEISDSSGEKKKQNKKSKAARKNRDQVKKLPEKKKLLYLTWDAQMDLVRQVLAEKLSEPKADVSVKNKMKQ